MLRPFDSAANPNGMTPYVPQTIIEPEQQLAAPTDSGGITSTEEQGKLNLQAKQLLEILKKNDKYSEYYGMIQIESMTQKDCCIPNEQGNTPLHLACLHNFSLVVRALINQKVPLAKKNREGETPLHLAAKNGHSDIVELLVTNKVPIDEINNLGETPLFLACDKGFPAIAKMLLKEGANSAVQTKSGEMAYDRAIKHSRFTYLIKEMQSGSVQKFPDNSVSAFSHLNIVIPHPLAATSKEEQRRLQKIIASFNAVAPLSKEQERLVMAIFHKESSEALRLIKNADQKQLTIVNDEGMTLLHFVLTFRELELQECALELIHKNVSIHAADAKKRTPLHTACLNKLSWTVIDALINQKADVNAADYMENTPLHWIIYNNAKKRDTILDEKEKELLGSDVVAPGHLENLRLCWLISRLIQAGAAVNAKNGFNGTPLIYAASQGLYPCMNVLLQNNADATIMDKFRLTALLFAKHDPHCPKNLRKTMEKSRLQPATSAASTSSNTDLSTHTQDKIELSSQLKKLKFIDLFEVIAPLSDQQRDLLEKLFMNNYKEAAEIIDNLDREQLAILNVFGETLLHILIRTYRGEDKEKFTQCAKLLISKCDSLKQVRLTFQQTPLHSSARSSPFLVELLVKNGADVNATTITGTTPLWSLLDSSNCSDEVRRAAALCLINAGADVDLKSHKGDTLLISTCKKGFFDSAKWLLDNGASTTIVDSNGKSAYDAAFACTMKKCPADLLERLKRR